MLPIPPDIADARAAKFAAIVIDGRTLTERR